MAKIPTEVIKSGGISYVITDAEKKTVKKLTSFENLDELIQQDVIMATTFLNTIYSYLREKDAENTSRRNDKVGNWIICRGFKIVIDETIGFAIYDMSDYARHCEEFDNPIPTPREVWDFINSNVVKEKATFVAVTEKKFVAKEEKHYSEKGESELTADEYELMRADLLVEITGASVPQIAERVYRAIPNRKFNHRVNKLREQYLAKEIRGLKFRNEIMELVQTHSFEETKKPARRFVGLDWYTISTLEVVKDTVSFTTKTEGRFHLSKSEFLARFILHSEPKVMPQMYRLINEQITLAEFLDAPILVNDRDAKFIDFNVSALRNSSTVLFDACNRLLMQWEDPNPLNICYKNNLEVDLKVGDFVEVFWKDYHTSYRGKVIDFAGGVRIRYEDGIITPLYKWQEFIVESKRAV